MIIGLRGTGQSVVWGNGHPGADAGLSADMQQHMLLTSSVGVQACQPEWRHAHAGLV